MKQLKRLIDVKSLVTLGMTATIIYLAATGQTEIKDVYLIIIAFYFGTQSQKMGDNQNGKTGDTQTIEE